MVGQDTDFVRRRQVFLIRGFDPRPARDLRELYRAEAARQAAISGHAMAVTGLGGGAWQVAARIEGQDCLTRVEVLGWADLVQGAMGPSPVHAYRHMGIAVAAFLRPDVFVPLAGLRAGPMIAGLYPALVLVLLAVLGLGMVGAAAMSAGRLVGGLPGAAILAAATAAALAALAWRGLFAWLDRRLFLSQLMASLAYVGRGRGRNPPGLEARLAVWAGRVAAALEGDSDEVLVIGHSSGAALAVSLVADVWRTHGAGAGRAAGVGGGAGPALALLTLGQAIPMQAFQPHADRLRRDLHDLAGADAPAWVDVTAPGDGLSFALCDPVAVTGVAPAAQRWPRVISAAFRDTLDPARWRRLRRRYYRLHMQYLHAFDRPADYDFFAITAGPRTLAARLGARPPSPQRRAGAVSRHRGLA